jgi:hypothetical protein
MRYLAMFAIVFALTGLVSAQTLFTGKTTVNAPAGSTLTFVIATPTSTPAIGPRVSAADAFLNSLGVNTNIIAGYDTNAGVEAAMEFTGQRLAREEATHNGGSAHPGTRDECAVHAATITAANPAGVLFDVISITDVGGSGDTDDQNIVDAQAQDEELAWCGALLQIEGPNEPNNEPFYYEGNYCSSGGSFLGCAKYMAALYAMHNAGTPNAACTGPGENTNTAIVGGSSDCCTGAGTGACPSLASYKVVHLSEGGAETDDQGLQFTTIPSGFNTIQPVGTVFSDVANLHNYIQGNGSAGTLADGASWNAASRQSGLWDSMYGEYCVSTWGRGYPAIAAANCTMPYYTTETGWQSNEGGGNITPYQQGVVETDFYGDNWLSGGLQTFIYLLYDNVNNAGYGEFYIYNSAETPLQNAKPAGVYLHNLTSIIADTSSNFTPSLPAGLSVSGESTLDHHLLLQKSNGTYELMAWGEAFVSETPSNETVNLGGTYPVVNVYDITDKTATQSYKNVSSVPITLADHMIMIEFGGAAGTPVALDTPNV